jgi:creatinine amidohydrolase
MPNQRSSEPARGGYSIFHDTMADMTYPEIAEAAASGATVLWGIGVIEQHGPHLPLATDVYAPTAVLRRVKNLLADRGVASLIAPPFYWGVNHVTGRFPGSFEVRPAVMSELIIDVLCSLDKDGFSDVFCLSGHGDAMHNYALIDGVRRGSAAAGINGAVVVSPGFAKRLGFDPSDPRVVVTAPDGGVAPRHPDIHAGESETSLLLGYFPDLVRREILPTLKSTEFSAADLDEWRQGQEHAKRMTPQGYIGDPAVASSATGIDVVERQAAVVAAAIAARLGLRAR